MTVPCERTNAVNAVATFLHDLLNPKKTPRVPKAIRNQVYHLLRHYPTTFDMDMIARREDGEANAIGYKVFGKGFK